MLPDLSRAKSTDPGAGAVPADLRADAPGAPDAVMRAIARALDEGSVGEALRLLNARTRFRFTGIYRAAAPLLVNVHLFDRENPQLNVSGDRVPSEGTYCAIVCGTGSPFLTADAGLDERLSRHPARASVISYAGVPLRLPSGRAWGSLCHFDGRPRLLPPAEQLVLTAVAPLLLRWAMEHASL